MFPQVSQISNESLETGLSLMVKDGEKMPALFSDLVFLRSKRWRSSTSQLSHPRFNLWGFGEVVPDGVGLAYAILPRSCVFNITALRSTGWTDKLSELLEEALLEMRRLVEAGKIPTSKL
jgi:carnitine O-acetyltransferase